MPISSQKVTPLDYKTYEREFPPSPSSAVSEESETRSDSGVGRSSTRSFSVRVESLGYTAEQVAPAAKDWRESEDRGSYRNASESSRQSVLPPAPDFASEVSVHSPPAKALEESSSSSIATPKPPQKSQLLQGLGFSSGYSPHSPKLKRKLPPRIQLSAADAPEKRQWSDIAHPSTSVLKSQRGTLFATTQGAFSVSTFIPRSSLRDTSLIEGNVGQKMIVDLPTVKVLEVKVPAKHGFRDFAVLDGYITGYVLRAPRAKLTVRIESLERAFSQGDSFFVPAGGLLSVSNEHERFSALLQLTIVRKPTNA